jgi:hypothetical protein
MAAFTNATVEQVGISSHEVIGFLDGGKHPRWCVNDAGCRADVQQGRKKPQITKISLEPRQFMRIFRLAQIARACGRVSVGGDPDKRPVNRQ